MTTQPALCDGCGNVAELVRIPGVPGGSASVCSDCLPRYLSYCQDLDWLALRRAGVTGETVAMARAALAPRQAAPS